jgi:hypothetical protein
MDVIDDLKHRLSDPEDTYMALVHRHEHAHLQEVSA